MQGSTIGFNRLREIDEIIECLSENFSIESQGAWYHRLFEILVKAASDGDSIENTAKILKKIPTANDVRYHLDKINHFEELETKINQALKSRIPTGIKKGCLKIAIDLNLISYYGNPRNEELLYIYRSQAKSGTCSFYDDRNFICFNKRKCQSIERKYKVAESIYIALRLILTIYKSAIYN